MVCKGKNHINIVNLLDKYERRFQANSSNHDWRLGQYLKTIFEMLDEEEQSVGKLNDELFAAKKRAEFFKGLLEAQTQETSLDKYKAINSLPTLITRTDGVHSRSSTKAIHLTKIAKCEQEIRKELFQTKDGENVDKIKKLHSGKNFDDIVKYHKLLQENVTNEMIELTRNLKHNLTVSSEIVKKDTELLERTNKTADVQYSRLQQNANKIGEFASKACEYWIWISLVIVIVTFLTMVIFIRIF